MSSIDFQYQCFVDLCNYPGWFCDDVEKICKPCDCFESRLPLACKRLCAGTLQGEDGMPKLTYAMAMDTPGILLLLSSWLTLALVVAIVIFLIYQWRSNNRGRNIKKSTDSGLSSISSSDAVYCQESDTLLTSKKTLENTNVTKGTIVPLQEKNSGVPERHVVATYTTSPSNEQGDHKQYYKQF